MLKLLPLRHGVPSARRLTLPRLYPPVPKKNSSPSFAHGVTAQRDPYRWTSDTRNRPDLLPLENAYAESFSDDTANLRRELVREMSARLAPQGRSTVPERWGPCMCQREGSVQSCAGDGNLQMTRTRMREELIQLEGGIGLAREEVVLDWNEVAERHGYVDIGMCRVSPDHRSLYAVDTDGSEQCVCHIKDISSKHVLPTPKVQGVVSLAWASDSCSLFYTVCDKQLRPYRVLCSGLGSDDLNDIFSEHDPDF